MKNIPIIIILANYYFLAVFMLDIISHDGYIHGIIFLVLSILLSLIIVSVFKKKTKSDTAYWELFKKFTPSIIGVELILLFSFRLYILSQI